MEVREALLKRRSVRKFTAEPVSDEMIDELMHAAMSGPSAVNMRPWEFFVITNETTLSLLRSVTKFTKIVSPMAIVVCVNRKRHLPLGAADFWVQDCSAATENILLRACDLGLGTVWCGIYPNDNPVKKLSRVLGLDKDLIPLNIIFVGHPAETPEARDQYDEKLVHLVR